MNKQEFINMIGYLNSVRGLTQTKLKSAELKFIQGGFVADIVFDIKFQNLWKKIWKITDEISNEIQNYIQYLMNKYEENPNEYEGKKEFLIEHLDGLFTYQDLVGCLDPTHGWLHHEDRGELLNYLYNKVDSFKDVKKSEIDDILSSNRTSLVKLLLLILVDETLEEWEKKLSASW